MPTELTWIANTTVSWLHTAEALSISAPIADAPLAEALTTPADALRRTLDGIGVEPRQFFRHATLLAYHEGADRQLAEVALRKTLGPQASGSMVAAVASCLTELKRVGAKAQPKLLDELTLRSGPIRGQWEARGPGLLAGAARRTDSGVLVESATVFVVHPISGGGGATHPAVNSVRIEAVLANPRPELPEVVRLAWLVATLNTDLPRYVEGLSSVRRHEIPLLALVPPVLDAAVDVELIQSKPQLLETALVAWGWSEEDTARLAPHLAQWWRTYLGMRLEWPAALVALERLTQE